MKSRVFIMIVLLVVLGTSCVEMNTEIAMNAAYSGDQLAIMGYLSNQGVVVNVQKTTPPLNDGSYSSHVDQAKVTLHIQGNDAFEVGLTSTDGLNYFAPGGFTPNAQSSYYIKVSAVGLKEVVSKPQMLIEGAPLDTVYFKLDTNSFNNTISTLFGVTRNVLMYGVVTNQNRVIPNQRFRYLAFKGDACFKTAKTFMNNWVPMSQPTYFDNPGGSEYLDDYFMVASDHFETGDSVIYSGRKYAILERIDSLVLQSFTSSSDIVYFLNEQHEYDLNSTSPFSALRVQATSNMSNGIGFFGSINIREFGIKLPPLASDSANIYQHQ